VVKKVEAYIRPERFEDVKEALKEIGVSGMNTVEVHGYGRQGGIELSGRRSTYVIDMLPRIQMNIILGDNEVENTVATIRRSADTGSQGDGIIFIYPVDEVVRINTPEKGADALKPIT